YTSLYRSNPVPHRLTLCLLFVSLVHQILQAAMKLIQPVPGPTRRHMDPVRSKALRIMTSHNGPPPNALDKALVVSALHLRIEHGALQTNPERTTTINGAQIDVPYDVIQIKTTVNLRQSATHLGEQITLQEAAAVLVVDADRTRRASEGLH